MGQTPQIIGLHIYTAAQQLVAAPAKEKTQIDPFGFLQLKKNVPRLIVLRPITQINAIKNAQASQAVAPLLDYRGIQQLATAHAHTALQQARAGKTRSLEFH